MKTLLFARALRDRVALCPRHPQWNSPDPRRQAAEPTRSSGADPQQNFFHRVLRAVSSPFTWIVRRITPPFIADRHVALATFALLAVAFVAVKFAYKGRSK